MDNININENNVDELTDKTKSMSNDINNFISENDILTEEQKNTLDSIKNFTDNMTDILSEARIIIENINAKAKENIVDQNYDNIAVADLCRETYERPKMLSPLNLAFIGDGVYELLVRQMLLKKGSMPQGKLHNKSTHLVCAKAQSQAFSVIEDELTEDELAIFKRGRNSASAGVPRNSDPIEYRRATGIETLFGYLYLTKQNDRMVELFNIIMNNANIE